MRMTTEMQNELNTHDRYICANGTSWLRENSIERDNYASPLPLYAEETDSTGTHLVQPVESRSLVNQGESDVAMSECAGEQQCSATAL